MFKLNFIGWHWLTRDYLCSDWGIQTQVFKAPRVTHRFSTSQIRGYARPKTWVWWVSFWAFGTCKQWNLRHGVNIVTVQVDECIACDYCAMIITVSTVGLAMENAKIWSAFFAKSKTSCFKYFLTMCAFCGWPALHKDTFMSLWRNTGRYAFCAYSTTVASNQLWFYTLVLFM